MANLDHVPVHCVVCGVVVPDDRKKRRSITCTEACAKFRNAYLRARVEAKKCKYCGAPYGEEQREDFKAWRRDRRAKMLAEQKVAKEKAMDSAWQAAKEQAAVDAGK